MTLLTFGIMGRWLVQRLGPHSPISMPTPRPNMSQDIGECARWSSQAPWIYDIYWVREISTRLSLVDTYISSISPLATWSLMKWWRISICFVLVWSTRLYAILIALSLSHKRGTLSQWTPYSFKVYLIHNNWVHPLAAATHSSSAVERYIQFCFLEEQHTKDLPRNWQAPEVDFLSSLSPA